VREAYFITMHVCHPQVLPVELHMGPLNAPIRPLVLVEIIFCKLPCVHPPLVIGAGVGQIILDQRQPSSLEITWDHHPHGRAALSGETIGGPVHASRVDHSVVPAHTRVCARVKSDLAANAASVEYSQ
jgi:hypothetical protein